MRRMLVALIGVAAVACSSSPGTFTGTVAGRGLAVQDAIFAVNPTSSTPESVIVLMADRPNLCTDMQNAVVRKNSAYSLFFLTAADTNSHVTTGKYTVTNTSGSGNATFIITDATCSMQSVNVGATAGTFDVTSYNADSEIDGTFALQYGADSASGKFSATLCNNLQAFELKYATGGTVCQ